MPYVDGPLEVDVIISSTSKRSIGSLAITIYDQHGTKLVNADTLSSGKIISLEIGENKIKFRIEKLSVNPGIYTLGVWMANPEGEVFDRIDSVVNIEVIKLLFDNTYGVRPPSDGLVSCEFSVQKQEVL